MGTLIRAALCSPKKYGGIVILNSKLMNVALLVKWIGKLSQNKQGLWADILRAKYFPDGNFLTSKAKGSPFWNGIQAVKPAFTLGAKFCVKNGNSTRFWLDHWLGSEPLWRSHFVIYQLATNVDILVADALRTNPPAISLKRPLLAHERASWDGLLTAFQGASLCPEADTVSWSLSSSGKFTVQSLYNKLTEGPTLDIARGLWKASIPLKIKVFLWQLFRDRLPSSNNIAIRHGPSDGSCALCGAHEDANHIFFQCHLARFAWSAVREAFAQNWNPHTVSDLRGILLAHRGSFGRVLWRCVGALCWSQWTTRNKMTIEHKFPNHPADIIFKCHLFLQTWTPLGKRRDADRMMEAMERIRTIQVEARA